MKPILYNTPMVQAILDGDKTQTRRPIKSPLLDSIRGPVFIVRNYGTDAFRFIWSGRDDFEIMPPYRPGDILWVRETWAPGATFATEGKIFYKADDDYADNILHWHPSIHMPRKYARIFLRVTDVGVERLWGIQPADICAEGVPIGANDSADMAYESFSALWDSTIKPSERDRFGWDANPWVFVYTFERCEKEDSE